MGINKTILVLINVLVFLTWAAAASDSIDCTIVTSLLSACSNFISHGSPDPIPGSPCCDAVVSLNHLADSKDNQRSVCRCLMGLISTYNPNATAIATLPGFCGIFLGFTIAPDTDCN